jgi:hypothetical protein
MVEPQTRMSPCRSRPLTAATTAATTTSASSSSSSSSSSSGGGSGGSGSGSGTLPFCGGTPRTLPPRLTVYEPPARLPLQARPLPRPSPLPPRPLRAAGKAPASQSWPRRWPPPAAGAEGGRANVVGAGVVAGHACVLRTRAGAEGACRHGRARWQGHSRVSGLSLSGDTLGNTGSLWAGGVVHTHGPCSGAAAQVAGGQQVGGRRAPRRRRRPTPSLSWRPLQGRPRPAARMRGRLC